MNELSPLLWCTKQCHVQILHLHSAIYAGLPLPPQLPGLWTMLQGQGWGGQQEEGGEASSLQILLQPYQWGAAAKHEPRSCKLPPAGHMQPKGP